MLSNHSMFNNNVSQTSELGCFIDYVEYISLKYNDYLKFLDTYNQLSFNQQKEYEALIPALKEDYTALCDKANEGDKSAHSLVKEIRRIGNYYTYDAFLKEIKGFAFGALLNRPSGFKSYFPATSEWFNKHTMTMTTQHQNRSTFTR